MSKAFRISLYIVTALVTVLSIYSFVFVIVQCSPVRKAWIPSTPGHCHTIERFDLGILLASVVGDLIIMLLPIPMIWNLHTGRARKVRLTGLFFCGYW